jgi:hypothetical protein
MIMENVHSRLKISNKIGKCRQTAIKISNNKFHENYFRGFEIVIRVG